MRLPLRRFLAPRANRAGAFYVGALALIGALLAAGLAPSAAVAQIPGISGPPADTLVARADSIGPVPELAETDSSAIPPDSVRAPPPMLPGFPSGPGPSLGLGVWSWDRQALTSTRAVTLAELVSLIPGVIALEGGDYGTPVTATSFGAGGGRIRVMWDGFEWVPLEGGVPDLSRIGLAGLGEVRVERLPGELLIEIRTREPTDPDPTSLVHVGTGDLSTNLLRGVFAHPTAFGGAFTLALDRLETRGPGLAAGGSLNGFALRYAASRGDRGGVVAEMKRTAPRTDVADLMTGLTRNDWNVRARWRFAEGLIGEGYWGASSLAGGPEEPVYGALDIRRTQLGVRARYSVGGLWAQGAVRKLSGHGVPGWNYEVAAGGTRASVASLDGSLRVERWAGQYAMSYRARIETAPVLGFSLFASYDDGETGAPFVSEYEAYLRSLRLGPPLQPAPVAKPRPRFTDRTGVRAGGRLSWRGYHFSGAWLSMKADSIRPLGIALDPDGISAPGGDRMGFEATAVVPLPLRGFALEGAVQAWDDDLAYLPRRLWDGALTFHGIFKESRNLEVWGGLGMTRRDPMRIGVLESGGDPSVPDLVIVPFSEEWYTHIQVRIVTLSLFIRWENIRGKDDNVDFPNREQPRFRTMYGVHWVMNN